MEHLINKAAVLMEALPYIQKFNGATFVVKYGGSFMDSPDEAVRQGVARDVVFLEAVEINPVVVHGGGKAISRAMKKEGLSPRFEQGHRVTDEKAVQLVNEVLSHQINPEIVKTINALGGVARGFSGTEIFKCRRKMVEGPDGKQIDIGYVGEVIEVNTKPLLDCIANGVTPVISPTAIGEDGHIHNCNADIAAAVTATALKARKLVFMSDVPGLLEDPQDPDSLISHLGVQDVPGLKQRGIIGSGMIPKVDSATKAIEAGVDKVSFVDGRVNHSVLLEIFTDKGIGTEIVMQ
ncbi:MAG: acetylglutamate kinase [Verrucomicrobia bacterium]|jgi:acetylglutamate kinase|nr:acetylglutamate kinase [Verrucomicrobiota bacterium]